jgi:hypothetical protein
MPTLIYQPRLIVEFLECQARFLVGDHRNVVAECTAQFRYPCLHPHVLSHADVEDCLLEFLCVRLSSGARAFALEPAA